MYKVETYLRIRQACLVDGKSQRQVSQDFNLNRRTVSKMLTYSQPPGYCRKRKVAQPKLDPHKAFIDDLLTTGRCQESRGIQLCVFLND